MSFLQPWLLLGLPLVALPLIIHLINQRRFQTIHWAAMMFLLAAHRMARGYSRLRQWLIMLFRMLAIAGLLFAASRPLASGWLGLAAGGKADTTIILLDRSPSMQERSAGTGDSKLETGRKQLVQTLETLGSGRWVLIESTTREPRELEAPAALLDLPEAGPASAPADLPLMLQSAYDYIAANRAGRTEVWICSDLRDNDWTPESGRWSTLRDAFLEFPQGVRFHLLAYPQTAPTNVSIRVTDVRREITLEGADLLVSLRLARQGGAGDEKTTVPVQFEIEGARSVASFELTGSLIEFKDHRIPLDRTRERGWGRVSIPADANPADDDFYFVFDNPPPRRTVVVADDPQAVHPLELAASIAPERGMECTAEVVVEDQLSTVAWDQISLLLWQAPLPTGEAAELVRAFVDRGGQVIFLPTQNPGEGELFGMRWQTWTTGREPVPVENWRSDADVLARTLSGAALPVGQLEIRQYCGLSGECTPLATLQGGAPLLARAPTRRGAVYFWATTPSARDSSLATEGVVLYACVQRALAAGAAVIGKARQIDAGGAIEEGTTDWIRLSENSESLSTEAGFQRGAYSSRDRLLAVNRPSAEDEGRVLADARVGTLFRGLEFARVDGQAGDANSLIQEIWRIFLLSMLLALLVEAALCLPRIGRTAGAAA
ncbi:BatA domain-containing protein [Planctellipticum variicoloris]|uniref:BatA domain-containing protein n=1 Tax=Planctellipticum variicoloris TaxID=3064265 RepID=UPI0030140599|nr:BatA domain-containing protein [Planctomycetaceae bacterium SH412]